ncbi:pYEATS domain-containing protein [Sorangium sp. So ce1153]|uniref:pYEATS domain-containing protein n=1 Tax=Sorangium sp. So ce1153 TaxID=3133333 RepID=UPI003F619FE6
MIERLAARNPKALDLATLASLAVRIEPELLRALRLELVPDADPSAEADFWWNAAVEIRGATAVRLGIEAASLLRARLLEDPARAAAAYRVIRRVHRGTSPLLRLEELVTWQALRRPGVVTAIERLLRPAAVTMLTDASRRAALAVWAARMLPRLPEAARRARSFWLLLFGVNAQPRGEPVRVDGPAGIAFGDVPAEVFAGVPDAHLEVERRGDRLAFRRVSSPGPGTLACPAIQPIVVEVIAQDGATTLAVGKDWADTPASGATARVRALDGREYEVRVRPRAAVATAVLEAKEVPWAACAKITHASGVTTSGYLVEPTLVVTVPRQGGAEVTVDVGGARRRGLIAREDPSRRTTVYRLDEPVLSVTPLRIAAPPASPQDVRMYGYPTGNVAEIAGRLRRGEADDLLLDFYLQMTDAPGLAGAPLIANGAAVGHYVSARHPREHLGARGDRVLAVVNELSQARARLEELERDIDGLLARVPSTVSSRPELDAWRARARAFTDDDWPAVGEVMALFETGRPGARLVALSFPHVLPTPELITTVWCEAIERRRSAFEQLVALEEAQRFLASIGDQQRRELATAVRAARRGPTATIDGSDPRLDEAASRIEASLAAFMSPQPTDGAAQWDTSRLLDPGTPGIYARETHEMVAREIQSSPVLMLVGGTAFGRASVIRRWLATRADRSKPLVAWSFEGSETSLDAFTAACARIFRCEPTLPSIARMVEEHHAVVVLEGIDRVDGRLRESALTLASRPVNSTSARRDESTGRVVLAQAMPERLPDAVQIILSVTPRDPAFAAALDLSRPMDAAMVERVAAFGIDVPVMIAYTAASEVATPEGSPALEATHRWLHAPFAANAERAGDVSGDVLLKINDGDNDAEDAAAYAAEAALLASRRGDVAPKVLGAVRQAIASTGDRARVHAAIARALLGSRSPSDAAAGAEPASRWLLRLDAPLPATQLIVARERLRQAARDPALEVFADAADPATLVLGARPEAVEAILEAFRKEQLSRLRSRAVLWIAESSPAPRADDTQKGLFGGLPERDGRRVVARVERRSDILYEITVEVVSTDQSRPLRGEVVLHLHETFGDMRRALPVVDGKLAETLFAWGAFTLGVETDGGRVRLELELSNIPGATHQFIYARAPGQDPLRQPLRPEPLIDGHALIAAVSRYHDLSFPRLARPVPEAQRLALALTEAGYQTDNVHLLLDEAVTEHGLRTAFARLLDRAGPHATVVVVFIGHSVLSRETGVSYLALADSEIAAPRPQLMDPRALINGLRNLKAGRLLLVLDTASSPEAPPPDNAPASPWRRDHILAILTKSDAREGGGASSDAAPSLTELMIEAVTQRETVSIMSLLDHAQERLGRFGQNATLETYGADADFLVATKDHDVLK